MRPKPTAAIEIVLVHGTFARGATWIREDSAISKALRSELPHAELSSFMWSGRNSHSARIDAGQQLANYLAERKRVVPSQSRFLVAHSHGGNVVLYALAQSSTRAAVDGCVFLGTPFLIGRARNLQKFVGIFAFGCAYLLPTLIATALAFFTSGESAAGTAFLAFAILTMWMFALSVPLKYEVAKPLGRAILCFLVARQAMLLQRFQPPPLRVPSLVCRALGDEARSWLRALGGISSALPIVARYVAALPSTIPVWLVVLTPCFAVDWFIGERAAFLTRGATPTLILPLAAVPLVLALTLIVPAASILLRAHVAGFGWEGIWGYSVVEISAGDLPVSIASVAPTVIELPLVKGSSLLRHSRLYEDSSILARITEWIRRRTEDDEHQHCDRRSGATVEPTQSSADVAPSSKYGDDILRYCFVFQSVVLAVGIVWTGISLYYPFDNVSADLKRGDVVTREALVSPVPHRLAPNQRVNVLFTVERDEDIGRCYLHGTFHSNSAEAHVAVLLEHGGPRWKCAFDSGANTEPVYASGIARRNEAFSVPMRFDVVGTTQGCIVIYNDGKKTTADVDVTLLFECVASNRATAKAE